MMVIIGNSIFETRTKHRFGVNISLSAVDFKSATIEVTLDGTGEIALKNIDFIEVCELTA
jgi:hypothetical protein